MVKIGGSVLADKSSDQPSVDEATLRRLAQELGRVSVRPLVVVHGAGAFGHQIVHRTGIDRGLTSPESRLSFGQTQRLVHLLNIRVTEALLEACIPVMPVQASALAIMRERQLEQMELAPIRQLMAQGMVPLLYGVPAVDRVQGCSILSGDVIAPRLARELGLPLLVHATDVDGVFTADPAQDPAAQPIRRIDRHNWGQVRALLGGSRHLDVTGGMAGKVEALLKLARSGVVSRIVSARIDGQISAALSGADVGTLVTWDEA